jgi:Na+(H+)/acetate symporter ActP
MEFTYNQVILYGIIAGFILGLILGLILLFLGIKKGKKRLGIIALISSIVVGAISGVFSILIAIVFTWLILKDTAEKNSANDEPANEIPVADPVKNNAEASENQISGD